MTLSPPPAANAEVTHYLSAAHADPHRDKGIHR